MEYSRTINDKTLDDYRDSFTLRNMIANIIETFYDLDEEGKKNFLNRFDNLLSEYFAMPKANFIYENNEHVLDTDNIYIGKIDDLKSGLDLIGRYLFEKRQQYQRLCIKNKDQGSFNKSDFINIKSVYEETTLSRKTQYIPYSKGFDKYILNHNKVDALLFMLEQLTAVINMVEFKPIYENVGLYRSKKIIDSINAHKKFAGKFQKTMAKMIDSGKYIDQIYYKDKSFKELKQKEFLLLMSVVSVLMMDNSENIKVFLCFHENVWRKLNEDSRKSATEIANETICSLVGCEALKSVEYNKGKNSYQLVSNESVHVGNIMESSARDTLAKLIYEYTFEEEYEKILSLDEEESEDALKEYEECKNKLKASKYDYNTVMKYDFISRAVKKSVKFQKTIYDYINNNLYVDNKKIKMPMSKEEFVIELFSKNKRR